MNSAIILKFPVVDHGARIDGWDSAGVRHFLCKGRWTITHKFIDGLSRFQLWQGTDKHGLHDSITCAKAAHDVLTNEQTAITEASK